MPSLRYGGSRWKKWLPGDEPGGDTLARWALLAVGIGAVAGLGAAGLFGLLKLGTHWVLGELGGYHPYRTTIEGGFDVASSFERPWAVPLVVAAGALVAAALVRWLAPEAGGHGTDAAIAAAHHAPLSMRGRVTIVKMIASALTIGSGGSAGTEGPAAQISAAFGSVFARRARLTPAQARTAVVIGLAAGVGAVFRAPLGGALLGAELLYRKDADVSVVPKALLASAAGYAAFGVCFGFGPVFGEHAVSGAIGLGDLPLLVVIGLLAGGAGRLYAAAFYWVHDRVEPRSRTTLRKLLFPAAGGLAVGCLGLLVPGVLGTGYGLMEGEMERDVLLGLSLWAVLLVPFAKIVGTALTVGSGASGGIFGPGFVVGAGVGAAVWRLAEPLGWAPQSPAMFVIVGMAACLGPVVRAPVAVLVMAVETGGDSGLLGPGVIGVLSAALVMGGVTIYRSQLDRREAPAIPQSPAPAPPASAAPGDTPYGEPPLAGAAPGGAAPAAAVPVEARLSDAARADTPRGDTAPAGAALGEGAPVDAARSDAAPADAAPADTALADAPLGEPPLTDTPLGGAAPVEVRRGDTARGDTALGGAALGEGAPVDAGVGDAALVDAAPADTALTEAPVGEPPLAGAAPGGAAPADPVPVKARLGDAGPADRAVSEPAMADAALGGAAPVDAAPVEAPLGDAALADTPLGEGAVSRPRPRPPRWGGQDRAPRSF